MVKISDLNTKHNENDNKKPSLLCSVRFLIGIMALFYSLIVYLQRVNVGISIICMVNDTAVKIIENITDVTFVQIYN
jgi:uncharacterized membrane-anchored protein